MLRISSLIFSFFAFSLSSVTAQNLSVGVSTGLAIYQGDVTERYYLHQRDYNPVVGGFIKLQVNDKISLRANYLRGEISGSDSNYPSVAWRMQRGFSFKSPITEMSVTAEWDIIKKYFRKRHSSKKQSFSLYLLGGVGYLKTNPVTDFNEPNPFFEDVSIDKFAEYNRKHLIIPIGLGIKWHITPDKTLSIESSNRITFTDYLDGISKTAQPKYRDWFLIGSVSFSQQFSLSGKNNGNPYRVSHTRVSCPRFD